MSRRGSALTLALSCVGFACGGSDGVGPPPPPPPPPGEPGALNFHVVTAANLEDGGLLLTVLGGAVDSVTGLAGYEVFHTLTATGARAMVFGPIVDGPLIQVWVPDVSRAGHYSVGVDEGAIRGTYDVVPGAAYSVTHQP
ncbi:MAG: hypothetical protein ACREOC_00440 [Gemmatimonadales bacterium]